MIALAQALRWSFGVNVTAPNMVHSLYVPATPFVPKVSSNNTPNHPSLPLSACEYQRAIFYAASHTGVIFDVEKESQYNLQGHVRHTAVRCSNLEPKLICTHAPFCSNAAVDVQCNAISACCVSPDKRVIVTAETSSVQASGTAATNECVIIAWETQRATPIKTFVTGVPAGGVCSLDISADGRWLLSLSEGTAGNPVKILYFPFEVFNLNLPRCAPFVIESPQQVQVWDLTPNGPEVPVASVTLQTDARHQVHVCWIHHST